MDTNQLTADYIWNDGKDEERLHMALQVYEAMDTVRWRLIEVVFVAVHNIIHDKLKDHLDLEMDLYETSLYFKTRDSGECYVYAEVKYEYGKYRLHAGIWAGEKPKKGERNEIDERLKETCLQEWDYWSNSDDVCTWYATISKDWYDGDLLAKAIRDGDEVKSGLADVLLRIYGGVFPLASS